MKVHTLQRNAGLISFAAGNTETIETPSPVWRIAWNVTGTVIAASAEDGSISLWRRNFAGKWNNIQNLPSDLSNPSRSFYEYKNMY